MHVQESSAVRELTSWEKFVWNLKLKLIKLRRKFPYLVWYGDELDVTITFSENPINQNDPVSGLYQGLLPSIECKLDDIGINFDKGQGLHGRDWEWDWSLSGPISIKFRGTAQKPERRR